MSEVVGEAVLRIRTDDSGVDRGIEQSGKQAGSKFAKGFSGSLKTLAGAAGLALGADKAFGFLKDGIGLATSFQDEMGALNVIIGKEGTAAIEEFSKTSAKAFGISQVDALEASHTFATFGKVAGLTGEDLAKFSTDFTGLAGDLASFNGGSTEDAITAIGAALRGENESIRRYGVLLDDATLRQRALRLGLIKTTKQALTPQQKILAAQAEIYAKTADAQGDSARTADSAANKQKQLTAQLKDLRLEVGTKLLPVVTDVTAELSEFITGMQEGTGPGGKFADIMGDLAGAVKAVAGFIDGLPGPVKKYGVELAIAAVALSKLNGFMTSFRTGPFVSGISTAEGRMGKLKTGAYQLGGALRNVAGAGGMLAFQHGLSQTNDAVSVAETTLGGFAAGFALGGPIGAGIGAGIGLFMSLKGVIGETADILGTPVEVLMLKDLITGLDAANGKATELTKSKLFDFLSGKLEVNIPGLTRGDTIKGTAARFGIPDRQLINAMSGDVKAFEAIKKRVNKLVAEDMAKGGVAFTDTDRNVLFGSIETTTAELKRQRAEMLQNIAANKNYGNSLNALPAAKKIAVEATGIIPTVAGIARVAERIKATPKEVETLIAAAGVPTTLEEVEKVRKQVRSLNQETGTPKVGLYTDEFYNALAGVKSAMGALGDDVFSLAPQKPGANQAGTQSWRGGLTRVGETGPELVFLPRGSGIKTAAQSQQIAARAAGGMNPKDVGREVAAALVAVGAVGPTIINPVPEPAQVSQNRVVANTAFLLGV